ncbi:rRNA pseudouridine synthase [Carnobacteriaceae bacterium zg-ZUI252]|nr:rRNA pseudouridine synthase [Carnobacteriaceae bacterium zg-ZUI252]
MRLDKYLGQVGVATRTQAKQLVKQGRITINDQVIKKSDIKIDEYKDTVCLDGKVLHYQKFVYYMLNKPQNVVSATQDNLHQTVMDLLNENTKDIFPVGRLDIDTTGLLLLTNDGQLAHSLLSPKKHVSKVYHVTVEYPLSSDDIEAFKNGIVLSDGFVCQSATLDVVDDTTAYVTICEGKFHQVKRMFLARSNRVLALKRVAMGPLKLDETLPLGAYRELTIDERESLLKFK